MIREQRNREKLRTYYQKFMAQGILDPNVHPWVGEAWQKSRSLGVPAKNFGPFVRLTETERGERLAAARAVIRQLDAFYDSIRDFLSRNNISILLLDAESYVLKSYTMSFYQRTPGELEGARLAERDIGASSVGIAAAHRTPFVLFGPEIWIEDCHDSDAATAPIIVDDQIRYLVTMVVMDGTEKQQISMDALMALLQRGVDHLARLVGMLHCAGVPLYLNGGLAAKLGPITPITPTTPSSPRYGAVTTLQSSNTRKPDS